MTVCANNETIRWVSENMCAKFDERLKLIPSEMCAPFREEASKLVSELNTVAAFAAQFAKKEDDLDLVAGIWLSMVGACDECLLRLGPLCDAHPFCAADIYHDQVLDLRNRCQRLYELHA
jgi:hypothetical protein